MSFDRIETGTFSAARNAPTQTNRLHIVSWNIARGSRMDEISEFLLASRADLIFLQESDCGNRRTAYRNVAKDLARTLGMAYAFGIEFQELSQGSGASPAYHGQATLSRWPLTEPSILRFRSQSKFWQPQWWIPSLPIFQRRIGSRIALLARMAIGNRSLVAYNLHLESRNGDDLRCLQIAELLNDARQYGSDVVVIAAGDFNVDITELTVPALSQPAFENPFAGLNVATIPSGAFGRERRIDWILIRGNVKAESPQVHNSIRASDHFPLSLTLHLP